MKIKSWPKVLMFLKFYFFCLLFGSGVYAIIDYVKIRTLESLTAQARYEIIRESVALLEKKYLAHRESDVDSKFNELGEYSIYSLRIENVLNLQSILPPDKYARMLNGEIVILDNDLAFKKIKGTNKVLSFDIRAFNIDASRNNSAIRHRVYINGMIWLSLLLAIFCYTWLSPIWRDVKKVREKALLLSAGDLSARVGKSSSTVFNPIAAALDDMADKIKDATLMRRAMTNTMAHELRTPIARIRFHLHNYLETTDSGKKELIMESIYREIHDVESLIDTALSYASIENYNKILSPKKQYISTWFDEKINSEMVASKNIRFIKNYGGDLGWVYMDMNLMAHVLSNLLGNAKKYTKSIIKITVIRTENTLVFSVEDDGKGIAPEDLNNVFKPFYRGKGNKKLGIRGFGLGLTIVDKIVSLHRGSVYVAMSELGGACFMVKVPCDYQH